jgi:hypothetical protein
MVIASRSANGFVFKLKGAQPVIAKVNACGATTVTLVGGKK